MFGEQKSDVVLGRRRNCELSCTERRRRTIAEVTGVVVVNEVISLLLAVTAEECMVRKCAKVGQYRRDARLSVVSTIHIGSAFLCDSAAIAVVGVVVVGSRLRIGVF